MTTWAVRTPAGTPVADLSGLASALHTTRERAAKHLLSDADLLAAAPERLRTEIKAATKPGDGTPPPISNGTFVSWSGGKGRVDLVVSKGKVPGVEGDVEGTEKSPAARVVVWKDGKPTREKVAASTHTLKRIAPLNKTEAKTDPASVLVQTVAEQNVRCDALGLPGYRRVTGQAVKAVFERGIGSWPGETKTVLSSTEWALGRVEHFVKVVNGEVPAERAGHDTDLLSASHPLVGGAAFHVNADDLDAQVKSLLEAAE